MKGASASDYFEYFKKLAGVEFDYELAPLFGKTKSAISEAKRRGAISAKMLAAASCAFKMTLEELEAGLAEFLKSGFAHKSVPSLGAVDDQARIYWDAWQQAMSEIRQLQHDKEALYREKESLYREKEILAQENADLRVTVARLEERLMVAQGGGYSDTPGTADGPAITIAEESRRAAG